MTQLQIRLYRDSFNTPWGFRLQGGKDLGQVLSVQRVFSNSPAENELQRGDLILAIGGRDGNELTHKQALDLIKHGGGQIQLVVQRPAPGQVTSPISFKPQRPRAPTLQLNPVNPTPSGPARGDQKPQGAQHFNPCYNPNFLQLYPPSSSHSVPHWAAQACDPKKVSKLSRLGGGGVDFGVDYGALFGTVLKRRHSTHESSSLPHLQSAGGNPAPVASLSRLGGGGFDFGTDYCTLPRKAWRHKSQPPPPQQPTSYGFQPKKINLSSLGGGGSSFGTDYSSYRPSVTQPVHVLTGPKSPGHNVDMLNKVQETLDNISLSPRTPDYGYQAPAFPASPPGGGQYIPTAVRLDMERQQEMRRQQHLRDNPPYVPTAVLIDQQMAAAGKSLSPRSPGLAPWGKQQDTDTQDGPAWKSTLKPTSIKPWDADLDYVPSQQQAPRSTGFQPGTTAPPAAPYNPAPAACQGGDDQDGPKVVHLQYNSPMGLYSNQNIQETFAGQTKAMTATGVLSPGDSQGAGAGAKQGDRDWTQSALYRMIHEDDRRGGQRAATIQQRFQPPPPQPAPKPQVQTFQQSFSPSVEEFGTSEF
ncbi:uncharacterized protein LOC143292974 isoform X1 [Babylonia areolata]|uniref:uncharacterized protein LOC143292974 isoform X1 n=1 Tax=Babylonia areolata TaxID=304850 RepID=UPI003FD3B105